MTKEDIESKKIKILNFKKQIISISVILVILIITVYVLKSSFESLDIDEIWTQFLDLDKGYFFLALICMFAYIFLEARALGVISRGIGIKMPFRDGLLYSAADIYFSAITPSATGGQPASMYYMSKRGYRVSESGIILIVNISQHVLALLVLNIFAMIWNFDLFTEMSRILKIAYGFSYSLQSGLAVLCVIFLFSHEFIVKLGKFFINLLYRMRFIKYKEEKVEKLENSVDIYNMAADVVKSKPSIFLKAFFYNFIQRIAFFSIAYFVYRAFGLSGASYIDFICIQSILMIIIYSLPLPGGVGAAESSFVSLFAGIYGAMLIGPAVLFTRMLNYYLMFIICGIIVVISSLNFSKKRIKRVDDIDVN